MSNLLSRYLLGAVVLSFMCSGLAQAACEWSDRISEHSLDCLSGEWHNQLWPKRDTAWVRNECSEFGSMVAKIERQHATDWTVHLTGGDRVEKSGTAGDVRGIYCCTDLSEMCAKSDVINADGCTAQFEESIAYRLTFNVTTPLCSLNSAEGNVREETCTLDVTCGYMRASDEPPYSAVPTYRRSTVTYPYLDVPRMSSDNGNPYLD